MKDAEEDGLCPVRDKSPVLLQQNELALSIFRQSEGSGRDVHAKSRVHRYLRPVEIEAVMRMRMIPEEDREELFHRVLILQEETNRMRPMKRRTK